MKLANFFQLPEALDSSYPYEFKNGGYYFTTDAGEEYKVLFNGNNKKVEVSFMARGEENSSKAYITGAGDSRKVFGTVINAVKDYVGKNNPEILVFSADNSEPSRIRLYNTLAAQAGRALPGYNFAKSLKNAFETAFYLTRDNIKVPKLNTAKNAVGKALDAVFEDDSDYEIRNLDKLNHILVKLADMVVRGEKKDPEYFGMVAACVLDPDNNIVARLNCPDKDGKRIHAERAAMVAYYKQYGEIPKGSIIITTLSPCCEHMDDRAGESCTDLINDSPVHKVYCGYSDPTQDNHNDRKFTLQETNNPKIRAVCKALADTFLDTNMDENFADGKNPEHKGDSRRHGIPKHATLAQLDKIARQGGRKGQLAHWQANMRRGRKKAHEGLEEAIDRDDAIAKIKKLTNTSGRTENEIENVKRIINKLMQEFNIKPSDISPVDPLKAKIAKAAYEKQMAAAAFKSELSRFKNKMFAEDSIEEAYTTKQQVIDHFVRMARKRGKDVNLAMKMGASAWERGWREPKPKAPKPTRQYRYPYNDENEAFDIGMGQASHGKNAVSESIKVADFKEILKKFLPLAKKVVKLDKMPTIVLRNTISDNHQPTMGRFHNDSYTLELAVANRQPVDILRTLAHELTHAKQDSAHVNIDPTTGSIDENEANAMAGIVMRHFNKKYPEYLSYQPVEESKANGRKRIR